MYKSYQELWDALEAKTKTLKAVNAEAGEAADVSKIVSLKGTPEEIAKAWDELNSEVATLQKQEKSWRKREKVAKKAAKLEAKVSGTKLNTDTVKREKTPRLKKSDIPARARAYAKPGIKGEKEK